MYLYYLMSIYLIIYFYMYIYIFNIIDDICEFGCQPCEIPNTLHFQLPTVMRSKGDPCVMHG